MGERGMWAWCSCPSSRFFNFVQQQSTRHCAESACGAYQAFFDSNIQADFVHVDDLEFTPDLLEDLKLQVQTKAMGGRFFLQQYQLAQVGRPTPAGKDGDNQS